VKPEELTPAQTSDLNALASRAQQASLCVEPADRGTAEAAVIRLYASVGLAPPSFHWYSSPVGARTRAYLAPEEDLHKFFFHKTRIDVTGRLEKVLIRRLASHGSISGSHLANGVWERLTAGPIRDLQRLLERELIEGLDAAVRAETGEGACILAAWVDGGIRNELIFPSQVMEGFGGQFELPWAEHYRFLADIAGDFPADDVAILEAHAALRASCGPWWPMKSRCLMSERPRQIGLDDRGIAHGETGPAVAWADWKVWALEGVALDESTVLRPESITVERIRKEENEEVRRVLIGRYGWERFLHDTGAVVVDMDADADGILRALMKSGAHLVLVCACTSTGRTYTMEVDPACTTCADAAAWLAGDDKIRIVGQS
jgi:hypothetical protein